MPEGTAPDIATSEVIFVSQRTVACDGGVGPLGHPRVFMTIVKDRVMCPYCSRIYVLRPGAGHDSAH
jgi:uncharacterized Zn-finger protein